MFLSDGVAATERMDATGNIKTLTRLFVTTSNKFIDLNRIVWYRHKTVALGSSGDGPDRHDLSGNDKIR